MQTHMPLFAKYFIFAAILLYFQDISFTMDAGSLFPH